MLTPNTVAIFSTDWLLRRSSSTSGTSAYLAKKLTSFSASPLSSVWLRVICPISCIMVLFMHEIGHIIVVVNVPFPVSNRTEKPSLLCLSISFLFDAGKAE